MNGTRPARKNAVGQSLVSWEELKDGDRESFEPHDEATPERVFNRRWALTLLELAIQQLHKEYMAARKAELFDKLKEYLTAGAAEKTYQELAAELNISPGAVKVAVVGEDGGGDLGLGTVFRLWPTPTPDVISMEIVNGVAQVSFTGEAGFEYHCARWTSSSGQSWAP